VAGQARWQLREISGGSGYASQNALYAHFGLGDATTVDVLRVEWPSGVLQEVKNVAAKQFLILKEPARLSSAARLPNGDFQLTVRGGKGLSYSIESSSDLVHWSRISTNTASDAVLTIPSPPEITARFFRAVED
jgi:hypothetical protein